MDCGIEKTLLVIGKKWTVLILREILYRNFHFGVIGRNLGVSDKVLAQRLRELDAYGVVRRNVDPEQTPPSVQYRLTRKGRALLPVFMAMYAWGQKHYAPPFKPLTKQ
jgi:DNA-binding HxlR family transcriptional regulator